MLIRIIYELDPWYVILRPGKRIDSSQFFLSLIRSLIDIVVSFKIRRLLYSMLMLSAFPLIRNAKLYLMMLAVFPFINFYQGYEMFPQSPLVEVYF